MDRIPGAAEDDRVLYLAYLKTFCGIDIPQELFRDIIMRGEIPESVFRRRREIVEERRAHEARQAIFNRLELAEMVPGVIVQEDDSL